VFVSWLYLDAVLLCRTGTLPWILRKTVDTRELKRCCGRIRQSTRPSCDLHKETEIATETDWQRDRGRGRGRGWDRGRDRDNARGDVRDRMFETESETLRLREREREREIQNEIKVQDEIRIQIRLSLSAVSRWAFNIKNKCSVRVTISWCVTYGSLLLPLCP